MSSSGAPTRDVLLVSAIITVSLSVTIVLCGLCHWCQRKLVRLLRGDPLGLGLTLHPAILQSLACEFYGVPPKQRTCLPPARNKCTELHTTNLYILGHFLWLGLGPIHLFTPGGRRMGTNSWSRARAGGCAPVLHLTHKELQTHTLRLRIEAPLVEPPFPAPRPL